MIMSDIEGCSKHGNNGEPDCSLCWEALEKLLNRHNCYVTGDNKANQMEREAYD